MAQEQSGEQVQVVLRGGTYFLNEPVTFTPEDSGSAETAQTVVYQAYPGERPIVSGGQRITGWKTAEVNGKQAWSVVLPEVAQGDWYFQELFVNGERRWRPRLPKEGFYRVQELVGQTWQSHYQSGTDKFIYADNDLCASWQNLQDIEITVTAFWVSMHMRIEAVDESRHMVTLDRNSGWRMSDDFDERGGLYWVENVFEELTEPGQWYLDRPTGTLYYLPKPGETLETTEVIAPRLSELVHFQGTSETPVERIHLCGLTFSHAEWHLPPDEAMVGNHGAWALPGAVILDNAQECQIEQCTFEHLGHYAVDVGNGSVENRIIGCHMHDLGGGGVRIQDGVMQTWVTDCEIHDIGLMFQEAMGVRIGAASGNKVLHNHIHHLYQSGIAVGWNFNYGRSNGWGNIVEYNHIHDFGLGFSSDLGGIYALGPSPGTRIRYNIVHDGSHRNYGDKGIYLDECGSDILVESNLIYNVECGFDVSGLDNVFRNNIFALTRGSGLRASRTATPPHVLLYFEHNIVYFRQGDLFWANMNEWGPTPERLCFRKNVYFDASGKALDFRGQTFAEWQQAGRDTDSVVADPLFVDPEHDDFRLRPDSPALRLGFNEWDFSAVGPRPERRR